MAGKLVSLTHRLPFNPGNISVASRVRLDARAIVRLERLRNLKKSNDLIGNRNRELPACSIVPQPTALLRTASSDMIT
jgi:uncharacterized lipoprotein YbaY